MSMYVNLEILVVMLMEHVCFNNCSIYGHKNVYTVIIMLNFPVALVA